MMQVTFAHAIENSSQVSRAQQLHTYHCVEYLRQGIRCAADPALDATFPVGHGNHATMGLGSTHVCRDYGKLFQWAEEHRITNTTGLKAE